MSKFYQATMTVFGLLFGIILQSFPLNIFRSPQGDLLASCSSDKTIKIWGKGSDGYLECKVSEFLFELNQEYQATLEGAHKKTIRTVCWTPDGSRLLSVGFDSQMCVWEKKEDCFECVATMEGHENEVICKKRIIFFYNIR